VAAVLAIAALLSLKTQMSIKRDSDELELLMMTAFVIGFTIPMLQFCMQAGPRSIVGWIGADAVATWECEQVTDQGSAACTSTVAQFSDAMVRTCIVDALLVLSTISLMPSLTTFLLTMHFHCA